MHKYTSIAYICALHKMKRVANDFIFLRQAAPFCAILIYTSLREVKFYVLAAEHSPFSLLI